MNPSQLKQLNSKKSDIEAEINILKQRQSETQRRISEKQKEADEVIRMIDNAQQEPTLTEHAILRFLERSGRVNVDEIKSLLMTDKVKELVNFVVNGNVPIFPGMMAKVKNKSIVTIFNV